MSNAAARRAAEEFTRLYGTGIMAYVKQGWNEIPEIMASSAAAAVSGLLGFYLVYRHYKNDGDNREYKYHFTIMRPDDPRAEKVMRLHERLRIAREAAAKKKEK